MKIIILDDDQEIRNLLQAALTAKGHEVHAFADPTKVSFFHGNDCPCSRENACSDVLIADIVMPQMEGIELIKKLNTDGCWPLSVGNVAVMSGYLTLHYMDELNEMGIQYFRKPFELNDIYTWLEKCESNIQAQQL